MFSDNVEHFLDGLMAGGSTNMVDDRDDAPMGECILQDSLDNEVFCGTLRECRQWYEDNADFAEPHYLYDENERCWEIGASFAMREVD